MNKNLFRFLLLTLTLLLCLGSGVACTPQQTPDDTEGQSTEASTAPTEETTEKTKETTGSVEETTEASDVLWEPDMGIFNEGKVVYTKAEDGSITATPTEGHSLGLDVTDKYDLVSICYSIWFDYVLHKSDTGVDEYYDISKALSGEAEWGGSPAFHYWSKPALGYYCSSNREVIRTHMTQLYTAGVDFIILDHTNLSYWYVENPPYKEWMIDNPMTALFETIMEMRAEGLGTPYVVVWCGSGDQRLYDYLYDNYYGQEKWADCFVYWDNKPFMLTTTLHDEANPAPAQFTTRCMGGLLGRTPTKKGQWNFLAINNAKFCTLNSAGEAEQICVCVASQETYMSADTAHGRLGGLFWYAQWTSAFKYRPKFVTLTWWNEWTAQRFYNSDADEYYFVDAYSPEYSRDIEPMEGGHGDQYYRWMIEYISAYKNHKECPILVEEKYLSAEYEAAVEEFLRMFQKGVSGRIP
ncbi:MAG: hypothetical protein E7610_03180 [Ruminococcaceae bacterium]|nr:hypothetical protein [Oscillospiraceae bacterium]